MKKRKRLVTVGGVAAGMSAAAKARRTDPEMEIVVYERSGFISYGACGLPYYIQGLVPDHRALIARTPEQFARRSIQAHIHHEVVAIDPEERTVQVRDLEGTREFEVAYDRLVLATGGSPARHPIPGLSLEGVFTLRTVEDGIALRRFIEEQRPRRAVVVGGGYVGVEMAEVFRHLELEVKMVIRSGKVMRTTFDDDVRAVIEEELARQGVEVVMGKLVVFEGRYRVEAVITEDGRYPCDVALLGIGVRPEVPLARAAGVALGATGAIATDSHMRTNLPGVYAAGDCAEAFHLVTGEPAYIPLGTTANKQGRVAGENAAGGDAVFHGVAGTAIVKVFDLEAARTGLTEREARKKGLEPLATTVKHISRAHYYPGGGPLHVRLVFQRDGRLLGAQMVGRGAAKRIDVIAAALQAGWGVEDLGRLDLSYAPPFAPVWDPILVAANVAGKM